MTKSEIRAVVMVEKILRREFLEAVKAEPDDSDWPMRLYKAENTLRWMGEFK